MRLNETKLLNQFGQRVRQLREERGWTLEYCEELGWPSWRHLQQIETGKKDINLTTLKRLSLLFGIDISNLVDDI